MDLISTLNIVYYIVTVILSIHNILVIYYILFYAKFIINTSAFTCIYQYRNISTLHACAHKLKDTGLYSLRN